MHITLHITTGCNMTCDYCYSPPSRRVDMPREVAEQCIEFISRTTPVNTGLIFFGGEPLLKKELIIKTVNKYRDRGKNNRGYFHFKITTNGLLLDEEFVQFAAKSGLIKCDK